MCTEVKETTELVLNHLIASNCVELTENCQKWDLQPSILGDRGLFATCDIQEKEIIFVDSPLIFGPRAGVNLSLRCVICHKKSDIKSCSKGCGVTVCCQKCENSDLHKKECDIILSWLKSEEEDGTNGINIKIKDNSITRFLAPIRSLFMSKQQKTLTKLLKYHTGNHHGFEVDTLIKEFNMNISEEDEDFMRIACGVMDANAFEVVLGDEENQTSFRGLYPLAGLANHRCYPNATHVFDGNHRMVVKAASFIAKGEEIFHSYTRLTWNTVVRRYHLNRTKHFTCNCERCKDPTEFGSNLSGVFCKNCTDENSKGLVLPVDPLNMITQWKCKNCDASRTAREIGVITSICGSRLGSFSVGDIEDMFIFLKREILPPSNYITVELKLKIIWSLGHIDGYRWEELSDDHLDKKEDLCEEVLQLLKTLKLGLCKMRALLLYEASCCMQERHRRIKLQTHSLEINNNYKVSENDDEKVENYRKEASEILKHDVSAPLEIKRYWE